MGAEAARMPAASYSSSAAAAPRSAHATMRLRSASTRGAGSCSSPARGKPAVGGEAKKSQAAELVAESAGAKMPPLFDSASDAAVLLAAFASCLGAGSSALRMYHQARALAASLTPGGSTCTLSRSAGCSAATRPTSPGRSGPSAASPKEANPGASTTASPGCSGGAVRPSSAVVAHSPQQSQSQPAVQRWRSSAPLKRREHTLQLHARRSVPRNVRISGYVAASASPASVCSCSARNGADVGAEADAPPPAECAAISSAVLSSSSSSSAAPSPRSSGARHVAQRSKWQPSVQRAALDAGVSSLHTSQRPP